VGTSAVVVQKMVRRKGPGLLFATIQKYRDSDSATESERTEDEIGENSGPADGAGEAAGSVARPVAKPFEVLNEDDTILVLVDEAHRTQAGDLHLHIFAKAAPVLDM
jgi:type I restriction enzyme, R subunit